MCRDVVKVSGYVCIVGGANIDIKGVPQKHFVQGDSNPGKIEVSLGGVGRNIGENLSRLGVDVRLVSMVGSDDYGRMIIRESKNAGLNMEGVKIKEGGSTSTYLCILDNEGDMAYAVSDMSIFEDMDIPFIDARRNIIEGADVCVIDTNIPGEVIEHIVSEFRGPEFFLDTVSTAKAEKVRDIIGVFHTIKPNKLEAEILSGLDINSEDDLKRAGRYFIDKGVKRVFISMGEEGVYYSDGTFEELLLSPHVKVVNATGAGDAFVAGLVFGFAEGLDIVSTARFSMSASILAINHENTINPLMCRENVRKIMMEVFYAE